MNDKNAANTVIRTLQEGGFNADCPQCEEQIKLKDCGLFYRDDFTPEAASIFETMQNQLELRREAVRRERQRLSTTSYVSTTATNIGTVLEHLAPSLSSFRFACSDCRSLFGPIDYVIFEGLCNGDRVTKILFGDVKTGKAVLTPRERAIRDLVRRKKVEFDIYEVSR
jgi:predicted Holliday junction resolvase-like endonuclease